MTVHRRLVELEPEAGPLRRDELAALDPWHRSEDARGARFHRSTAATMMRTPEPTASRTAWTRRASASGAVSLPSRSFTAPNPLATCCFAEAASSSGDRLTHRPSLA